jgi:predicted branched-subunit amino acid permease
VRYEFGRTLAVVGVTVVVFGVSFGFLARGAGLSGAQAVIMSLLVMAGATQFAAVTSFAAGASVLTASVAGVALSLRYLPLGAAAGRSLSPHLPRRLLEVHILRIRA